MFIDPISLGLTVTSISGDEARCLCPFHDDAHPSASFNMEKGLFHCLACGTSANVKQLLKVLGGELISKSTIAAPSKDEEEILYSHYLLSPQALGNEYLKRRHVSDDLVKKYAVLQHDDGIVFPLWSLSGITGVIIRRYEGKPKYVIYGSPPPLWNMDALRKRQRIYVTEGIFAALRLISAGHQAVATLGSQKIREAAKVLSGRDVIIVFDPDFSGYLGAAKFASLGFDVALPTIEADETPIRRITIFVETMTVTRSIMQIAEASGEPDKLIKLLSSFMSKKF